MYVYVKSEPHLWTVGFYDPHGKWHPESDYDTKEDAAERVHYLNGGNSQSSGDGGPAAVPSGWHKKLYGLKKK